MIVAATPAVGPATVTLVVAVQLLESLTVKVYVPAGTACNGEVAYEVPVTL